MKTARDYRTVTWVMQDRYLSSKINMSDSNWIAMAVPGLLINALKYRLNSPFEGRLVYVRIYIRVYQKMIRCL